MRLSVLTLMLLCFRPSGWAQLGHQKGDFGEETALYAETKQVNQFFRRFNAEERRDGERLYPDQELYHDPDFREGFLDILFDNEHFASGETAQLKQQFSRQVLGQNSAPPFYLDFHGSDWFAELECMFQYEEEERPLTLFLRLEADRLGHKWVIDQVRFEPYAERIPPPREAGDEFLHPLSHELDFMNLSKVFRSSKDLAGYLPERWTPDPLTLFLLDIAEGQLVFRTVRSLRFHFLQVPGWYFRLEDVQREGFNTGWLITELQRIDPAARHAKRLAIQFGL
jgi:hypothetical protein